MKSLSLQHNVQQIPIAIVGIACHFPGAPGAKEYWRLLYHGDDAIQDVPDSHWSIAEYFDEDPKKPDHVYCKRGAFLSPVSFDPSEFGIPPASLEATDTSQLLGLMTAKAALEDAGYGTEADFDRDKASVILGVTGTQELVIPLGARLGHPLWRKALKQAGIAEHLAEQVTRTISDGYVSWQENSFPGLLGNVVAGRICNRLNLGGTNCVVDAACASSLGAIHLAVLELQSGRSDLVVSGGVDTINDIFMTMCFSRTMILSPSGDIRPFSEKADGTVLGEGIGMLVLKRLADAEKDGDRIYAVIRGTGSSSDGRSQSIYAPRAEGQVKAIQMAYVHAGFPPATVGMIEAHGTGTRVGDQVEFSALKAAFGSRSVNGDKCALGSVKSMIGHTKAAAGAAGMIKAALALKNKVILPTLKALPADPKLAVEASPFYLSTETRPWFSRKGHPRRAGVSSFGFGGSNFHIVLEEHNPQKVVASWNNATEIVALSAMHPDELFDKLAEFKKGVAEELQANNGHRLAADSRAAFEAGHPYRLILVHDRSQKGRTPVPSLVQLLDQAEAALQKNGTRSAWHGQNIFFGCHTVPGKLAFLFPGQGSQYVNMGRDLTCTFPEMMQLFEKIDDRYGGHRLTDLLFPLPAGTADVKRSQEEALRDTGIAQPAIGGISLSMVKILARFGVTPDAVCGHSFGELSALWAAGWMDEDTFLDLAFARGRAMALAGSQGGDGGAMIAVKASMAELTAYTATRPGLVLANINSPQQGVLSGPRDLIEQAFSELNAKGFRCMRLPVSAAFHSPLMKPAADVFRQSLQACRLTPVPIPVLSNTTGKPYPRDAASAKAILCEHLLNPVQFMANIEYLHQSGIQTFIEVGPKSVLTGLVKAILEPNAFEAIAMDAAAGSAFGLADLARVLSLVASLGYPVQLASWEEPAAETPPQRMQIPICGANYRTLQPKIPQADTVRESNQLGGNASGAPKATPPAETPRDKAAPVPTDGRDSQYRPPSHEKPTENKTRPKMKKETKPWMQSAIRSVQEGLAAMQALQAQTTEAHKKFLDTQAQASRTLQQMMESTRRLAEASLGIADTVAFSPAKAVLPSQNFVIPQEPSTPAATSAEARSPLSSAVDSEPEASPPIIASVSGNARSLPETDAQPPVHIAAVDTADIEQTLLSIVSELTGYPIEMLNQDMDIEADLGIDSIKRVEILSTLEERVPHLPSISPEMMGGLKTLGQIVAFLAGSPRLAEAVPAQDAPAPVDQLQAVDGPQAIDTARPDIRTSLLDVVSELTGYPAEMLDLTMDIEADLGIDSIKRVEILSTLEERVPHLPSISPDMMGSLKTLGQIADFLGKTSLAETATAENAVEIPAPDAHAGPAMSPSPEAAEIAMSGVISPLHSYVLSAVEAPLNRSARLQLTPGKPVYVLEDSLGLSSLVVQRFIDENYQAELLSKNILSSLQKREDPLSEAAGLVIISDPEYPNEAAVDLFLENAFRLANASASPLNFAARNGGALFATVTRLDGMFGLDNPDMAHPAAGGLAGLLKTAAVEWEGVTCRAMDIDPRWSDRRALADAIARELIYAEPNAALEIGISATRRRRLTLDPLLCSAPDIDLDLAPSDVVIVSGGARGVTAAAAAALAERSGASFALIGRSPAPFPEPAWLEGLSTSADIKRAILENEFNNNGASPRDIEMSYQKFTANREILHTLDIMRKMGISVHYYSADIRNAQQIESLAQEIRKTLGPIRTVIHGAGVIGDRLIVDKTPDQFKRVYETKVIGLRSLLKATRNDDLRYLVLFSSIAARFGNKGQVDYAVANEVLNKTARRESANRDACRVVSINWGPWDGGMVGPLLKREFLKNQVGLIPLKSGASFMLEAMAQTDQSAVEIVASADPLPQEAPLQAESAIEEAKVEKQQADRMSLLFKREIDAAAYPILDAHKLDGKPVVPFALITEWFGHGALHENPGLLLHGIDDMRILKGIKLEKHKKIIRLFAGKASKKGWRYEVPVELRDGVLEGVDVIHSRAKAILVDSMPEPPLFDFSIPKDAEAYRRTIEEVYDKILFHGSELRGILEITGCASWGMAAKISTAPLPGQWMKEPLRSAWISDPLALDCAFQLATVWCYEETGSVSLPSYCRHYRQYCTHFPSSGLSAVLQVRDVAAHKMTGDITLLSGENQVVAQLTGYEAVIDPSLYRAFKPHLA